MFLRSCLAELQVHTDPPTGQSAKAAKSNHMKKTLREAKSLEINYTIVKVNQRLKQNKTKT